MRFCKYLSGLTKPELDQLKDMLHLTEDEAEVFNRLSKGHGYTKIALERNTCERTVCRIAERIKKKVEKTNVRGEV